MKTKNYEAELPQGYREVFHINAKDGKTGILLTLASLVPMVLVLAVAFIATVLIRPHRASSDPAIFVPVLGGLCVCMTAYLVCHELLHGAAYKALTGQKLTFGMSWSCAFCGVPDIYVYRKASMIALILPFAVFGVIFGVLTVALFFVNGLAFWASAFLLATHAGGCIGDLYLFCLFLFRYRDRDLLMRDSGPEQWIYVKN